jgi:hypothetical protein
MDRASVPASPHLLPSQRVMKPLERHWLRPCGAGCSGACVRFSFCCHWRPASRGIADLGTYASIFRAASELPPVDFQEPTARTQRPPQLGKGVGGGSCRPNENSCFRIRCASNANRTWGRAPYMRTIDAHSSVWYHAHGSCGVASGTLMEERQTILAAVDFLLTGF